MKQELRKIKIGEIIKGFSDNEESGVVGYDGKLDIRPPYQREFVYDREKQDKVIETVFNSRCLGLFTWAEREDGTFEIVDGQQRTLSICHFIQKNNTIILNGEARSFKNFSNDERDNFLNYEIIVNVCNGTSSEKLDWFKTINVAGVQLTTQELRNACYTGAWLSDAKMRFSCSSCAAYNIAKDFVKGSPIRQEFLETALEWISRGNVETYMCEHQHDPNANELWLYFLNVIEWAKATFNADSEKKGNNYRKEMLGLDWGKLYEKYHLNQYDAEKLEERINDLMANDEVTDKRGVYEYVLSGEREELARKLSKRQFSKTDMRTAYERQDGICPITNEHCKIEDMEADHIIPWWKGGTTTLGNLQMISKNANRLKSGKYTSTDIACGKSVL